MKSKQINWLNKYPDGGGITPSVQDATKVIVPKTIKSSPDNNTSLSGEIRDFLHKKAGVPLAVNQLGYDLIGGTAPITESSLTSPELNRLREIVRTRLKDNKKNIEYGDYFNNMLTSDGELRPEAETNYNAYNGNIPALAKSLSNPSFNLQYLLGAAAIKVNKGDTTVVDSYDFNQRIKPSTYIKDLVSGSLNPYQAIESLGHTFGSKEGQGSPINIKINQEENRQELQKYPDGGEVSPERKWLEEDAKRTPQEKAVRAHESDPNFSQRMKDDAWGSVNAIGSLTPAWPLFAANQAGKELDKGEYKDAATEALMIAAPYSVGKGIKFIAPYLREPSKLNPWAFKPSEEMMYRGLGEEGYKDAISSGVFRPHQDPPKTNITTTSGRSFTLGKSFEKTYYTNKDHFRVLNDYNPSYIAEVPKASAEFRSRYGRKNDWSWLTEEQIPVEQGKIYKKDWLSGYKDVTPKFEKGGEIKPYKEIIDYNPIPQEAQKTKEDYGVYGVIPSAMKAYVFEKSYWAAQDPTPKKGEIQIKDNRKVDPTQRFNNKVDREGLINLVKGARERGLDPSTVLAMSLQESGINKFNPLHDNAQEMNNYDTMVKYAKKYPDGISTKNITDESLNNLVSKFAYAKKLGKTREEDIIQGWNGYGTISADRHLYGMEGPIDMSKNPVYGKRILDLRENVIKKNPEVLDILNNNNMSDGGELKKLDQLTNFTNYNPTAGKRWLKKYD